MNAKSDLPALLDGKTRLFGIIGHPIEQVKSPELLTANFRARGRNAIMLPFHILPEKFDETMRGIMALKNLDGLVATVPYKLRLMEYMDHVYPSGKRIGAVNASRREKDGTWSGDMFDGQGMVRGLANNGVDVKGKRVMMSGAGGVGSAIADSLAAAGVKTLLIHDIDEKKAKELAASVAANHKHGDVRFSAPTLEGIDIYANATAVGMDGNGMAIKADRIDPKIVVFDVITHDTPLLAFARQCGCKAIGGLPMTQAQADLLVDFILGER